MYKEELALNNLQWSAIKFWDSVGYLFFKKKKKIKTSFKKHKI